MQVTLKAVFALIITSLCVYTTQANDWAYRFDNDAFVALTGKERSDYWMTGAQRLTINVQEGPELALSLLSFALPKDDRRYSLDFFIGHHMFTPTNLIPTELIVDDRPYAGWLHGGLEWNGLGVRKPDRWVAATTFGLSLGVVGPLSGTEQVQVGLHEYVTSHLIDSVDPEGWDNQIENELAVLLEIRHQESLTLRKSSPEIDVTISPVVGAGTVMNFAGFGTQFRSSLCGELPPNLPFSNLGLTKDEQRPMQGANFFLLAGGEVRRMYQNVFVEGNLTRDSHGVELEPWLFEGRVGLGMFCRNGTTVNYTYTFQSREFVGQPVHHEYASISVSVIW